MYKIITGKYDPDVSKFVKLNKNEQKTRGHPYKLEKERPKLTIRQKSFVHRSCDLWNQLKENVVTAPSVRAFERRLDRQWNNQPFKYDPLADPPSSSRPTRKFNLDLTEEAASLQSEEDL